MIQGPRGEHGVLPGADATAGSLQCYTGGHGGMTRTRNICACCSNNGPSLMAGSGPLIRDSCQPQDYGPLNRSSAHGVGGDLFDGEHCIPHEQVLPSVGPVVLRKLLDKMLELI